MTSTASLRASADRMIAAGYPKSAEFASEMIASAEALNAVVPGFGDALYANYARQMELKADEYAKAPAKQLEPISTRDEERSNKAPSVNK